jgi:hypothetical protein
MPELERNHLLRGARLCLPSPSAPGEHANRAEVAKAVNEWLWRATCKRYDLNAHYLAKMERGVVCWPNAAYRSGLRHVLGAESDADLGFRPPCRTAERAPEPNSLTPPASVSGWDSRAVVERAAAITDDDLMPSSRRTVLTHAATLAGAALTAELEPFLRPVAMAQQRGSVFASHELDAAERLTGSLRSWRSQPGTLARRAVVAQLNVHVRRLREASQGTPETRRAFRIGAELAEIAASMSWDVAEHATAQRYFVLSAQLAHAAGDTALAAVALSALARQCFDVGRPVDGLEVVQLAQYGARHTATPRLRAVLATREAWAYAQQGSARAFHRAVRLAEDFHSEGECDADATTPTVRSLDEAELAGVIGARYRDLARVDPQHAATAQHYIGRALELRHPSRVRNRAFDLIGLARAHLITREPERAAELIGETLPLAGTWSAGRVGTKLRDFRREATPFARVRTVREACEAITELTTV